MFDVKLSKCDGVRVCVRAKMSQSVNKREWVCTGLSEVQVE